MGEEDTMSAMPGPGPSDAARVAAFLDVLRASTGELPISANLESRTRVIDERIAGAGLGLADKIAVFKALAPSAEEDIGHAGTGESAELRMERLLLSVAPEDLPAFKFALEYDLDYKDLEEYVFHDIDDVPRQLRILDHLKRTPASGGIKVLSDVDDTMYANLIDRRYPKGTFYPGVLDFYDAVKKELFAAGTPPRIHITTLSARPNPVAGKLEEARLRSLAAKTKDRLCPSALSGSITSSTLGTIESILRARRRRRPENVEQLQGPDDDGLFDRLPHGQEDEIGRAKFANFVRFAAIYPEYRFVFVGDSGQADALTAQLMLSDPLSNALSPVITTFIHDLRQSESDTASVSRAFQALPPDLVVRGTSPAGRGVVVFKTYVEAAIIAYRHAESLQGLITAAKLARVTCAALRELDTSRGAVSAEMRARYRQDAEEALSLVSNAAPQDPALVEEAKKIRRLLD